MSLKQAIPLNLQHKVLSMTAGRLVDKTSTVRKHAVQLLIVLMQGNPYAARLPLAELEAKLKSEEGKLDGMIQTQNKDQPPKEKVQEALAKCGPTKTEIWNAMEPEVLVAIQEVLEEDENSMSMSELPDDQVIALLNSGNYKRVARMLVGDEYDPVEILERIKEVFVGEEEEPDNREEMERLVHEAMAQDDQEPQEEESQEVSQQRMLVLYLRDSFKFARGIYAAIPVVCRLLLSKQTSDILEAINFFVTAFELDVLEAMMGIRRMLPLIWSSESDVKDAVVKAYKHLYMDMDSSVTPQKRAIQVVSNLTALISCSTQGELASLEELVARCVLSGDLPMLCITVGKISRLS